MPVPAPRELILRDPAQIRALASPLRSEILLALTAQGSLSARQIAARLGRDAGSLHYHLRKLVGASLVRRRGKQSMGPRSETVYEAVATIFRVDRAAADPAAREAMLKSVRGGMRLAEREFEAALAEPAYATGDDREQLEFMQQGVRLTRRQFKSVRRLLDQARRLARDQHHPDRGDWITITTVITPGATRGGSD